MSDVIKLLPDSVANQIAAGEVIQRPASVVKELMENSIDAHATEVQLYITEAGKSCVQVVDNGVGMSETDARLSFERHATSKISSATDLFSLRTMGFRGEALASIAAVAQVELRTRRASEDLGVCVQIEGSRLKEQSAISCPAGANFAVRNLFFNIPARRKFLKSNQTEMSNIMAEFERIVLAHPDIAFSLHSNGALVLQLPAESFRQRIVGVFGKKLDAHLVSVSVETPLARVSGFVGDPSSARRKGAHQFFFVNGRFMRHPYFAKAVFSAFGRLIPEGDQVSYFLKFEVDPSKIDVNIHPSKTEIKFQDEQALWPILQAAVREALGRSGVVPAMDFDASGRPDIPAFQPDRIDVAQPRIHVDASFNPFDSGSHTASVSNRPLDSRSSSTPKDWRAAYETALQAGLPADVPTEERAPSLYAASGGEELPAWAMPGAELFQLWGQYVVAVVPESLILFDQHRAHVRILYDTYLRQLKEKNGTTQGLLFPQVVQFAPSSATVFDTLIDPLEVVGFDISPLGQGHYSVMGIPAGTESTDPATLLSSILSDVIDGDALASDQVAQTIALSMARRTAISSHNTLRPEEMSTLLRDLARSTNPLYAPDGRPIQRALSTIDVAQLLK